MRKKAGVIQIHAGKQPRRPHFIPEWARKRHLKNQAELAKELGADKSVVSRWYGGASPSEDWQEKLADFFGTTKEGLFRHPDDDWITRFFRKKTADEVDRAKQMLEAAFPDKEKKAH